MGQPWLIPPFLLEYSYRTGCVMKIKTNFQQKNDKARILKDIIFYLGRSHAVPRREYRETVAGTRLVEVDYQGAVSPQFVYVGDEVIDANLKGSIVKCMTNPNHDWGVSRFVSAESDHYVLAEIGTPSRTICMFNERLNVLIGVPWHVTAEGWERRVYEWSIKAMTKRWNERADYYLRFRGAKVHGGVLRMEIGRHCWVNTVDAETPDGVEVRRYRNRVFEIPVNSRTRLKDIVAALQDADFDAEWADDELEVDEESTAVLRKAQRV